MMATGARNATSPEQRAAALAAFLKTGKVRQIMNPFGLGLIRSLEFVDRPEIKMVMSRILDEPFYRVDGCDKSFETLELACRYVVEKEVSNG